MTPNDKQLAMMAADIATRAAKILLEGDSAKGFLLLQYAADIVDNEDPVREYRAALGWDVGGMTGDAGELADAAVAAIADGKHPPTSLPGRVAEYRGMVLREMMAQTDMWRAQRCEGEAHAAGHVLSLLGCEVPR